MSNETRLFSKLSEIHVEMKENHARFQTQLEGVNRRLDINNGRLAKGEDERNELKNNDGQLFQQLGTLLEERGVRMSDKKWKTRELVSTLTSIASALVVGWLALKLGLG